MRKSFDTIAAMKASEQEELTPHLNSNDEAGAFARFYPINDQLHDWYKAELQRCGLQATTEALAQSLSVIISTHASIFVEAGMRPPEAVSFLMRGIVHHTLGRLAEEDGVLMPIWGKA